MFVVFCSQRLPAIFDQTLGRLCFMEHVSRVTNFGTQQSYKAWSLDSLASRMMCVRTAQQQFGVARGTQSIVCSLTNYAVHSSSETDRCSFLVLRASGETVAKEQG